MGGGNTASGAAVGHVSPLEGITTRSDNSKAATVYGDNKD